MKFRALKIENFMTFQEPLELPLHNQGLVLVRGDNRQSATADSNGVGKTAIFDALSFALFGTTLRGLKADDIACRFNKRQAFVSLELESDAARWLIERTRRPASLEFNNLYRKRKDPDANVQITQERINNFLGFGFRTFRNAVIFGQGAFERFASAGQADQLKMIDEIQNLDLGAARERAKEWRDKARRRLEQVDYEIRLSTEQRNNSTQQISLLKEAKNKFAEEKESELRLGENALSQGQVVLNRYEKHHTHLIEENERAAKLQERRADLELFYEGVKKAEQKVEAINQSVEHIRTSAVELKEQIKELLDEGKCPTCRTKFTDKVAAKVKDAFAPDLTRLLKKFNAEKEKSVAAKDHHRKLVKQHERGIQEFLKRAGIKELSDVDRLSGAASGSAIETAHKNALSARRAVEEATARLSRVRAREWEGEAPLAAATRDLGDAQDSLKRLGAEKPKVEGATQMADYWIEAFGDRGIRSLMFDHVADFLNERLAAHLSVLTGGEADVAFSALSALKSGAVKEKLSVNASWGWGAQTYASGSAGQDRRIDLAIFGAMQDLAERRSARPFPLRVWDEAGDSLDYRGKEVFAEWIREEARRRGSGFVVTHDRDFGDIIDPDKIWTVVLDKKGARVEIEEMR